MKNNSKTTTVARQTGGVFFFFFFLDFFCSLCECQMMSAFVVGISSLKNETKQHKD